MTHKKKLTEEDYANLEKFAYLGLTQEGMACMIGVSLDTFQRMIMTTDRLREVLTKGKTNAHTVVLNSLFKQITREEVGIQESIITVDESGKEIKREKKLIKRPAKPSERLLEFYLSTKMGFTRTDRIEHTGLNGDPIAVSYSKMTADELEEEIKKLSE